MGNIATNKLCKSHILYTLSMLSEKNVHKKVNLLAAQMLYESPLMIDNLLRASPELIISVSQKARWSWFDFRFSIFVFRFSFYVFRFSFSDIRTQSENPILIFKILFWHSNWVGKLYFDIQNPILTFELSREILFWNSKSYCDIRTELENPILVFKTLFWHSNWVGKSYFDI